MSRPAQSVSFRPRALAVAALGILSAAALLTSPEVASAGQPPADGMQTNVYYTLRDLATEQGTRKLYRRIVMAAQEVCPGYDSRWPQPVAASKECQRVAIAGAIASIGDARLAAIDARMVRMVRTARMAKRG